MTLKLINSKHRSAACLSFVKTKRELTKSIGRSAIQQYFQLSPKCRRVGATGAHRVKCTVLRMHTIPFRHKFYCLSR